jgi:hypothetical protein
VITKLLARQRMLLRKGEARDFSRVRLHETCPGICVALKPKNASHGKSILETELRCFWTSVSDSRQYGKQRKSQKEIITQHGKIAIWRSFLLQKYVLFQIQPYL